MSNKWNKRTNCGSGDHKKNWVNSSSVFLFNCFYCQHKMHHLSTAKNLKKKMHHCLSFYLSNISSLPQTFSEIDIRRFSAKKTLIRDQDKNEQKIWQEKDCKYLARKNLLRKSKIDGRISNVQQSCRHSHFISDINFIPDLWNKSNIFL